MLRKRMDRLRQWASRLKRDVHAVYLAARDPRTPWYVKALALAVAAYALSPIDLIPDFIPVVGYADDAVIVLWALRSVTRVAGPEALDRHWPGTPEGLRALKRLAGLTQAAAQAADEGETPAR